MDKKELKFYASPTCEVVELNVEVQLMAGSPTTTIEGVDNLDDLTGGNDTPGL